MFDIGVLADPRFPGGTSTAVASEVAALARGGYRVALLPVKGPVLTRPHPVHPAIRALVDAGLAELRDPREPVEVALLLVQHPLLFRHLPQEPLGVQAAQAILVVHHPPFDGEGRPAYDAAVIHENVALALGREPLWAPVGPVVRAQFARMEEPPPLFPADWVNVLDPEPFAVRRDGLPDGICRVGRHSRPDPLKWPENREAVLTVYPPVPDFRIDVLGAGPFLAELLGGNVPDNWRVRGFATEGVPQFLRGIDFYVYYHHPRWVEAFGRNVLEALAAGCVAVLPPYMRATFGDAAAYAEPAAAALRVVALRDSTQLLRALRERAVAEVRERFGPETALRRVREVAGPPAKGAVRSAPRRSRSCVLFLTSNGIGLGHLTRAVAVARHLGPDLRPVIVTQSQAVGLAREFGLHVEYLPSSAWLEAESDVWNSHLRRELRQILAFYRPRVVVFDGNMPYRGVLEALAERPELWRVWMRRAFWRPGSGGAALARESAFDVVLEPGEFAGALDVGPTAQSTERTVRLSPVLLLDPAERLDRAAACAALGLDPGRRQALVQLGSGNNFDAGVVRERAVELLRAHGLGPVIALSPIAREEPDGGGRAPVVRIAPVARYLAAFDVAICAAGYNSFHETVGAGLPTLFVPNEHPMMDRQLLRARWAERCGLGLCQRVAELPELAGKIGRLVDPAFARTVRQRAARLPAATGAREAARLVAEMACTVRADIPG